MTGVLEATTTQTRTEDEQVETPRGEYNHLKARERGLRRYNPADTLILDFQPPGL